MNVSGSNWIRNPPRCRFRSAEVESPAADEDPFEDGRTIDPRYSTVPIYYTLTIVPGYFFFRFTRYEYGFAQPKTILNENLVILANFVTNFKLANGVGFPIESKILVV